MVYAIAIIVAVVVFIVGVALIAVFSFDTSLGIFLEIVGLLLVMTAGTTLYILTIGVESHASWRRFLHAPQNYFTSPEIRSAELTGDELRWDPIPNAIWIAVTVTKNGTGKTTFVLPGDSENFRPVVGTEVSISYGTPGGPSVLKKFTVVSL